MSKRDVRFLCLLAAFFMFLIASMIKNQPPACPAPSNLEDMEVYLFLKDAITADSTPEEAIEAFAQMCEIPVECLDDQILFEYRYSEYSGKFCIHLARQFQFSDNAEYVQLHLDLTFPSDAAKEFPRSCTWHDTGRTDIRKLLTESESFRAVAGLLPNYTGVAIDWTW